MTRRPLLPLLSLLLTAVLVPNAGLGLRAAPVARAQRQPARQAIVQQSAGETLARLACPQQSPAGAERQPAPQAACSPDRAAPRPRPDQRAEHLRALAARYGVGEGSTVADIGAGSGRDSWVFAEIVGPAGTVFAEEIAQGLVDAIGKGAEERELAQVKAVLGRVDDPCLPEASVDLAFIHYVYHHMTQPREMLRGIWRGLKPGGYFVVVDRRRGTLRDWVACEERGSKHFWIAETTVVRQAREEGFLFVQCAEDCWPDDDQFVLVFQRPKGIAAPGRDPDPFAPLALEELRQQLLPAGGKYERVAFVALGEGRKLIGPILEHAAQGGVEIVLEEWATRRDERPPLPAGVELPSVLTDQGDPGLDGKPIDAVFFLDTYHLLFHHQTLLDRLAAHLSPAGRVFVLDRRGEQSLSHREASHRRKIAPQLVEAEMQQAGFRLLKELKAPAADRFLLVFGKHDSGQPAGN